MSPSPGCGSEGADSQRRSCGTTAAKGCSIRAVLRAPGRFRKRCSVFADLTYHAIDRGKLNFAIVLRPFGIQPGGFRRSSAQGRSASASLPYRNHILEPAQRASDRCRQKLRIQRAEESACEPIANGIHTRVSIPALLQQSTKFRALGFPESDSASSTASAPPATLPKYTARSSSAIWYTARSSTRPDSFRSAVRSSRICCARGPGLLHHLPAVSTMVRQAAARSPSRFAPKVDR